MMSTDKLNFMKFLKYILATSSLVAALFIPIVPAFAADEVNLVPCTKSDSGFGNLCPTDSNGVTDQVGPVLRNAIIGILVIAAVVALLFLIWGGFKWITSGGDKAKVQAARETIIAAIVGLIVAFLAYFILTIVLGLFGISLSNLTIPSLT